MRESSCDSCNGWLILINARSHVWRDFSANSLMWKLSIELLKEGKGPCASTKLSPSR